MMHQLDLLKDFKRTKALNCTNNFAYCTLDIYLLRKHIKNDTTDQICDY